ncbi:MAG: hypothetical protein OHK0053_07520 [Microscillaceae bacterium]
MDMKKIVVFVLVLGLCLHTGNRLTAQEFSSPNEGLMYSPSTMQNLSNLVDSLHLRFLACPLQKVYLARAQAKGHYFRLSGPRIAEARQDIEKGISWESFVQKYPEATLRQNQLIARNVEEYPEGSFQVKFFTLSLDRELDNYIYRTLPARNAPLMLPGAWEFQHHSKSSYSKERLEGLYFREDFQSPALPEKYARWVQYADCLTDTTARLLKDNPKRWMGLRPSLPDDLSQWSLAQKRTLLDSLRQIQIMGFCSMDNAPRKFARQLAIVAAEAQEWGVFIKAHLNILNDRFERTSDGSYAWAGRGTYLRELETLNLDIPALMLGIVLEVENPSQNHYFGSVRRVGRALAETQEAQKIEAALLEMLADPQLDDYNRMMAYFLSLNYAEYLPDARKMEFDNALRRTTAFLPDYMQQQVEASRR